MEDYIEFKREDVELAYRGEDYTDRWVIKLLDWAEVSGDNVILTWSQFRWLQGRLNKPYAKYYIYRYNDQSTIIRVEDEMDSELAL